MHPYLARGIGFGHPNGIGNLQFSCFVKVFLNSHNLLHFIITASQQNASPLPLSDAESIS
jgi:hypothetical protein